MSRLVLTRKKDESIVIHFNDQIISTLSVVKIDRNQVRLSFDADSKIKIDRKEVFDQKNS